MVMLKTGMERYACAMERPSASSTSQPKSLADAMIVETAVRRMVDHISSATLSILLHMISRETGSKCSCVIQPSNLHVRL